MVIVETFPTEILDACRSALGLPQRESTEIEDALLASLLRRVAGFSCPCSRSTLRAGVLESLQGLEGEEKSLAERIDAIIEGLVVGGDLLELQDVGTYDLDEKSTWVFSSPPRFIVRPSGSIFLTGIVPDHDTYLPRQLTTKIQYDGFMRFIDSQNGDNIREELLEQGLQEMSEKVWLKSPRTITACKFLDSMQRLLSSCPRAGTISELEILDKARSVKYYRGRWTHPNENLNGNFVARRKQEYGANIWCFVCLESGIPQKILDFPLPKVRWRGCDEAWRLQSAIDYCCSNPQIFRMLPEQGGVRFDFFSPLPLWSQRRFMILGRSLQPTRGALFGYWLPEREAEAEEKFLTRNLWMERTDYST